MSFYNPYHFVPVKESHGQTIDCPPGYRIDQSVLGYRSFDRYHENTHSGEITCRLETVTPTIIGSQQESGPDGYTRVQPFLRNNQPAIPATTLRGCISSLAEAASNSALRVLDNNTYSRRVSMDYDVKDHPEDYSALGLIVHREGELRLLPLSLPTLKKGAGDPYYVVKNKYSKMFNRAKMKAFCYNRHSLSNSPNTYENGQLQYYYAKLQGSYTLDGDKVSGKGGHWKAVGDSQNTHLLLGLNLENEVVKKLPAENYEKYVRGILRVLYVEGREDIPDTKKHELFLPLSEDEEENGETFPINEQAFVDFKEIAKARETEAQRRIDKGEDPVPYTLKGGVPLSQRDYELQAGDIVFFTPNSAGTLIDKIWISQIWRAKNSNKTFDFFSEINPELLPFHKNRQKITPAESLFGFVEIAEKDSEEEARALCSRLVFHEAAIHKESPQCFFGSEIRMRILASPKPPCPSFYFRPKNIPNNPGAQQNAKTYYIQKKALRAQSHIPQGRKFYLNHKQTEDLSRKASTNYPEENQRQKNIATPLNPGNIFYFKIDFENLSNYELGLLLYALQPTDDYHHKIGLGKSLGLGSVKICTATISFIQRQERYRNGFIDESGMLKNRYQRKWIYSDIDGNTEESFSGISIIQDNDLDSPCHLKSQFIDTMDQSIKKSIEIIGRPDYDRVKFPLASDQSDPEEETFKWFQNNDLSPASEKQGLVPLEFCQVTNFPRLRENNG